MDRLDAMAAFVAVSDLKGFAAAARRLKVSASAVTRLIAGLEAQLGIRLLQRTTRSVTLTDAGARYLERTRRILGDVEEAQSAAQVERTEPTGRFIVAAPNVFGRLKVAPVMCQYLARYPKVSGELALSDRPVNMVEEAVDVAIRIGQLSDASFVARKVGLTRRVVVASPAYLERRGRPRSPRLLAPHDFIHFTGISPTPEWLFHKDGEELRVPFTPRFTTNSADAAIGHAELGGGLSLQLAYQVADAVRAGRLEIVLKSFEPPPLPIQAVYPTTRLLSAKVRTFLELVKETCDWQFVELR